MHLRCLFTPLSAALLLAISPLTLAQGHGTSSHMDMDMEDAHSSYASSSTTNSSIMHELGPLNYFRHPDYAGWLYAHIGLMVIGWVVILPTAVALSAGRSRLAVPVQFTFLAVTGAGIFTSIIYDSKTPDLYEGNAHHKVGWAVTWIAAVWVMLGLLSFFSARNTKRAIEDSSRPTVPMSSQLVSEYQRLQDYNLRKGHRWSGDSGQGTERDSASLGGESRSLSPQSPYADSDEFAQKPKEEHGHQSERDESETEGLLQYVPTCRSRWSRYVPRISASTASAMISTMYVVLERLQVILGFVAITTGLVTWSGIFKGSGVFNGLAHWVKGGIFFWYGILTLGRWMGAFTDFGWAWNVRPTQPLVSRFASRVPSAEFIESFVIFLYGASNVFLEHLAAWGAAWTAQDLEHVSITVMFFGGGLLGMLIESETVRNLLNTEVLLKRDDSARHVGFVEGQEAGGKWDAPKTYKTSLNPVPGLVILLLGIMMSSHHQHSMVSTMIHAQWGTLFVGFALARAVTYILLYLSPPTSHFPSRPPSEIVAAFCLISGGLIFMASARDVVNSLEANELDAMFVFTIMMGLTCLTMAWATVLYAVKGWASRRAFGRMPASALSS